MKSGRVVSARALAIALVAIALLAAAPFVVADVVSERRVVTARARAVQIAEALRPRQSGIAAGAQVLLGEGDVPRFDGVPEWGAGTKADLKVGLYDVDGGEIDLSADPWRNAYVVNIGAQGPVWVLSAGPNGILETSFERAAGLQGDDVGSRVR